LGYLEYYNNYINLSDYKKYLTTSNEYSLENFPKELWIAKCSWSQIKYLRLHISSNSNSDSDILI